MQVSQGEAKFGEWPHVCALLKIETIGGDVDKEVKVYLCGASLIEERVLLTAGHCVNDTE